MPYALLALVLVILDQVVKYLVLTYIPLGGYVPFLPHICLPDLCAEHRGRLLYVFPAHLDLGPHLADHVGGAGRCPVEKLLYPPLGQGDPALLLAGAVGNLIDRALRGFVVDMFNVLFMNFAVFNVADICVVVGGIAAAAYYLLAGGQAGAQGGA